MLIEIIRVKAQLLNNVEMQNVTKGIVDQAYKGTLKTRMTNLPAFVVVLALAFALEWLITINKSINSFCVIPDIARQPDCNLKRV